MILMVSMTIGEFAVPARNRRPSARRRVGGRCTADAPQHLRLGRYEPAADQSAPVRIRVAFTELGHQPLNTARSQCVLGRPPIDQRTSAAMSMIDTRSSTRRQMRSGFLGSARRRLLSAAIAVPRKTSRSQCRRGGVPVPARLSGRTHADGCRSISEVIQA
jgi:hypothetical protein